MGSAIGKMLPGAGVPFVRNPVDQRSLYFDADASDSWADLLCIPGSFSTTMVEFDPNDMHGGSLLFQLKPRISHCEESPRYHLYGQDYSLLGHMEKCETHLRAKPGEFARVQVWQVSANGLSIEKRRSSHGYTHVFRGIQDMLTPTTQNLKKATMVIAVQGLIRGQEGHGAKMAEDRKENWKTTISIHSADRCYQALTSYHRNEISESREPFHPSRASMHTLKIFRISESAKLRQCVAVASKRYFTDTVNYGSLQPYLSVRIRKPGSRRIVLDVSANLSMDKQSAKASTRDIEANLLLLLCLAWSEETIWTAHDVHSDHFEKAMNGSADDCDVKWDIGDLQKQMWKYPFAKLFNWRTDDASVPEDTDTDDSEDAHPKGAAPVHYDSNGSMSSSMADLSDDN